MAAGRPTYFPFRYTAKVKRSIGFVVKQIFAEELVIVLLATVLFYPFSPDTWMSAILLFVAYMIAYEIGYAENDRQGVAVEEKPKLGANFDQSEDYRLEPAAWVWVVFFTMAGILLLDDSLIDAAISRVGLPIGQSGWVNVLLLGGIWLGLVLLGRFLFYIFNQVPIVLRVFAYVPLHTSKYFSLIVIFPSQAIGYALLCAQIVRTWALYAIRRSGGDIELMASQSVRLVFLVLILFSMYLYLPDEQVFHQWQTWVILIWCVVRAIPEARRKLFSSSALQLGMRARDDADR